jgi:hypothetical protein
MEPEFKAFGKIPRLFRDIVITEKIDGTNSAIGIQPVEGSDTPVIYAQSRKRIITPKEDNHGFAHWVWDNAEGLINTLGPGLHFGEWWGSGINRGYGLRNGEKRFSLFNTKRWGTESISVPGWLGNHWTGIPELCVVPTLYEGPFVTPAITRTLVDLRDLGSSAAPGFMRPEGIIIYHKAGNLMFKATIENDESPKGLVANG